MGENTGRGSYVKCMVAVFEYGVWVHFVCYIKGARFICHQIISLLKY